MRKRKLERTKKSKRKTGESGIGDAAAAMIEEKKHEHDEDKDDNEDEDEDDRMEGAAVDGNSNDQKNDDDDGDDDDDDEIEENGGTTNSIRGATNGRIRDGSSFLDSFYGLASLDPKERSQSAQLILHHCLFGPDANAKDAEYTFRRLINGVCSGRAAARQGNASALSSFLKVAFSLGKMDGIRQVSNAQAGKNAPSLFRYVRERLLDATDYKSIEGGNKSEVRDHQFGRLFGVLAIVRSGILNSQAGDAGEGSGKDASNGRGSPVKELLTVVSLFTTDLIDLFWAKQWLREPASHAIITLLLSVLKGCGPADGANIFASVVQKTLIPKLLLRDAHGDKLEIEQTSSVIQTLSAEQLAVAIFIQSHVSPSMPSFHAPLNEPILSTSNIGRISSTLSATSIIAQPRVHLIWETVWAFLAERASGKGSNARSLRNAGWSLREEAPVGDDAPRDILQSIVSTIIEKELIGFDSDTQPTKTTENRCSLAIFLVKSLCGVPFASSIVGSMHLQLDGDVLETIVLNNNIVRRVFLDVIWSGKKHRTPHLLKPMAVGALKAISQVVHERFDMSQPSSSHVCMSVIRAMLNCNVRFDSLTKTSFLANIIGLTQDFRSDDDSGATRTAKHIKLWREYASYLRTMVLEKASALTKEDSTAEVTGYMELLYTTAKSVLLLSDSSKSSSAATDELQQFKLTLCTEVKTFFMVAAFYDCTTMDACKIEKQSDLSMSTRAAFQAAKDIAAISKRDTQCFSYPVRSMISAKFFSLLAEHVHHSAHASNTSATSSSGAIAKKENGMYLTLSSVMDCCKVLEAAGLKRFSIPNQGSDGKGEDESDDDSAEDTAMDAQNDALTLDDIVMTCQKYVQETGASAISRPDDSTAEAKKRVATGITSLIIALSLHQLRSGSSTDALDDDDPDASDEDDDAEIQSAIENLKEILDDFMSIESDTGSGSSDGEGDDSNNPLLGLAESCANILSSPLNTGNATRGASPKLLREAIKFSWVGGLALSRCLATKTKTLFDDTVADVLLEAIGAPHLTGSQADESDGMDVDGEGMDDDDDDDGDGDSDDESDASADDVFGKAAKVLNDDDDDDNDSDEDDDGPHDDDDDGDADSDENDDGNQANGSNEDSGDDTRSNGSKSKRKRKNASGDGGGDSDSDVELDSSRLQSMLEEDSDAEVDEGVLEHHEGADAALAKLIKLRQEMRKAGTQAREKLEVSNQLRCTMLLELAFHRSDQNNLLVRSDLIIKMILPLLQHRKHVERSIVKLTGKGAQSGIGEKRSLLERVTTLIQSNLGKSKLTSLQCSDIESFPELLQIVASELVESAFKAESKEHVSCCGCGLALVFRGISTAGADSTSVSKIGITVDKAIAEWSTKRSKYETSALFETVTNRAPGSSARFLLLPLLTATKDARTAFLKCESFRLLSTIYSNKHSPDEPDYAATKQHLASSRGQSMEAFRYSLKDDVMKKTKSLRVVLKTLEEFIASIVVSTSAGLTDDNTVGQLEGIKLQLLEHAAKNGQALKNSIQKCTKAIEAKVAAIKDAIEKEKVEHKKSIKSPTKSPPKKSPKKKKKGKKK